MPLLLETRPQKTFQPSRTCIDKDDCGERKTGLEQTVEPKAKQIFYETNETILVEMINYWITKYSTSVTPNSFGVVIVKL